jgi:hypothetical protein
MSWNSFTRAEPKAVALPKAPAVPAPPAAPAPNAFSSALMAGAADAARQAYVFGLKTSMNAADATAAARNYLRFAQGLNANQLMDPTTLACVLSAQGFDRRG